MDGSAVIEIKEIAQEAKEVQQFNINGETYVDTKLYRVREKLDEPSPIGIGTLKGMAEYINKSSDLPDVLQLYLMIKDPTEVRLVSSLMGEQMQRPCFAVCEARGVRQDLSRLNQYMPLEQAIVMLKTYFVPTDESRMIIDFLSSVKVDSSVDYEDNGVSQVVEVREGIQRTKPAEVPEVINLTPYRTFAEIDQPSSPYSLRVRKGKECVEVAFFTSNSTSWMIEAVSNITKYLLEMVKKQNVVLIS